MKLCVICKTELQDNKYNRQYCRECAYIRYARSKEERYSRRAESLLQKYRTEIS